MIENKVVINTAAVPLVGLVGGSKHEVGRVIDSRSGVAVGLVEASEDEGEVTPGILRLHGAADGEAVAPGELHVPLPVIRVHNRHGENHHVRAVQNVCRRKTKVGGVTQS